MGVGRAELGVNLRDDGSGFLLFLVKVYPIG